VVHVHGERLPDPADGPRFAFRAPQHVRAVELGVSVGVGEQGEDVLRRGV
jgi:hypothetical protein